MAEGSAVLVAAQSGRALAQAARRAGLRPYVLDLFGDEDTLELAAGYRRLAQRFGTGPARPEAVLAQLDALAAAAGRGCLGVVLGSGFEDAPALIARIGTRHRLLGAGAGTVAALKDPFVLARLCTRLGIPHPPVAAAPVADPAGWLVKRVGGSGGSHVRPARPGPVPAGHYLQARVPGRTCALNVLVGAGAVAVLALTEQWQAPSRTRPFRYGGAIAPARGEAGAAGEGVVAAATEAVRRLCDVTGLRGLASADLAVDGDRWWLLEINPRPGATLDVLDRRPSPLLVQHVEACLGHMPRLDPPPVDAAGAEICYAARDHAGLPALAAGRDASVRDRPRPGARVGRGAPLCTVTARGPDAASVRGLLRDRVATLRALLDGTERNTHEHEHPPEPGLSQRERPDRTAGRAPRG